MIARYRQMPHGRLQFIVGTSLPPLTFCNLPKLPGCGIRTAQTNLLRAPGNYFDAEFRKLMGCVRRRDHLLSRAAKIPRTAPRAQLRRRPNFRAAAPPKNREFATAHPAIRSLSNDVFARGTSWCQRVNKPQCGTAATV